MRKCAGDPLRSLLISLQRVAIFIDLGERIERGNGRYVPARAHIEEDSVRVDVDAPAPGWLLVNETFYPGWTATVDGRATPVLRADYLLRAVRLPPGRHLVRLVYAPLTYLLGATITLATALALSGCAIATGIRLVSPEIARQR